MTPFDNWFRWFLDFLNRRPRPMPATDLSPEAKALLVDVFAKKEAAVEADDADAAAADTVTLALKAKDGTAADRVAKHAAHAAAAHDFIVKASQEIGFALPG